MMNPVKPLNESSIRVTVYPNIRTVVQLPTTPAGGYHTTFKVYVSGDDVHFVTGDYDAIEFVNTNEDSVYGVDPLIRSDISDFIYTGGAQYIAFRAQTATAQVRLEVVDVRGEGVSSNFSVFDDDYYTRYVSSTGPIQGYRMGSAAGLEDQVEDGGVTTRDLLWVGTPVYTEGRTDTIRGGGGSSELRADSRYLRIESADQPWDIDSDFTVAVWNRYWDANGNTFTTSNVGIADWIGIGGNPGFRVGIVGTNLWLNVADSGAVNSDTQTTATSGLKILDGPWGLWVVRFDHTANTASAWVRWPSGQGEVVVDISGWGTLTPSNTSFRFGASQGLSSTEGSLCEGYVWTRALADYELEQLYLGGIPR